MADVALPVDLVSAEALPADPPPSKPTPPHWHRVAIVLGAVVALVVAYQVVTGFVAYTDDAYVRSDLIAVAPEVTGRVVGVHIVDNQDVKAGDRLVSLDPEPFSLAVNQRKAELAEAKAGIQAAQDELATAQAALDQAASAQTYALQNQRRLDELVRSNNAPRAELDKANDDLRRADAEMIIARSVIAKARSAIAARQAAIDRAAAELAVAEWRLARTGIVAPAAGSIVNLTVRIGDTAAAEVPLIGVVDAGSWRIVANYKQSYVRSLKVGGTAWVWLDTQPWHFHRARIAGIARGISREPGQEKLLPYVAPSTDWIRLQRRIPVTIVLTDPPPDHRLYMGADARAVIFP